MEASIGWAGVAVQNWDTGERNQNRVRPLFQAAICLRSGSLILTFAFKRARRKPNYPPQGRGFRPYWRLLGAL